MEEQDNECKADFPSLNEDFVDRSVLPPSPGPDSCHDSCYDSDSSSPPSRRNSAFLSHEDISRKTSDTLGSEIDDNQIQSSNQCPDYEAKLDFTIKLGYKAQHLQEVLKHCGPNIVKDKLLGELIKVSKGDLLEESESNEIIEDTCTSIVTPSSSDNFSNLRPVVIDGSNVALSHGNKKVFSCRGIQIVVDWFRMRGHQDIKVLIPSWRKEASRPDAPITDQEILINLEKERIVVFTPSRRVQGKRVVCYDDRYIVKYAAEVEAIIVSNDTFRDLMAEDPAYKKVVEERLLLYSFINDRFMPPDDPLGRRGPSLDNFLRKEPLVPENLPPLCPYDKKCTYGNKCKYYHPERGRLPQKSVTEKLAEQYQKVKLKAKDSGGEPCNKSKVTATESAPLPSKRPLSHTKLGQKKQLERTRSLVAGRSPVKDGKAVSHFLPTELIQDNPSKSPVRQLNSNPAIAPSKGTTNAIPSIIFDPVDSGVVAKYPMHWLTHESLRHTMSEPNSGQDSSLCSGHLALAKKLSDEGKKEEKPNTKFNKMDQKNVHTQLHRTLSLKGSEDPRLVKNSHKKSGSGAKYYFGSDKKNVSVVVKEAQNQLGAIGGGFPVQTGKQSLSRRESYNHLKPPGVTVAGHNTVTRMASAPSRTCVKDVTISTPVHKMERQNSTSDPQLYIPNKEGTNEVFVNTVDQLNFHIAEAEVSTVPYTLQDQLPQQSVKQSHTLYPIDPSLSEHSLSYSDMHSNVYSPANFLVNPDQLNVYLPSKMQTQSNPNLMYIHRTQNLYQAPPNQLPHDTDHTLSSSLSLPLPLSDDGQDRHLGLVDSKDALLWGNSSQSVNKGWPEAPPLNNNPPQLQNLPRDALYFHLCGLFPREQVGRVMREHPDEKNPAVLCKYIISME